MTDLVPHAHIPDAKSSTRMSLFLRRLFELRRASITTHLIHIIEAHQIHIHYMN